LMGIDEYGNRSIMMAGRKQPYQFAGKMIREIPIEQMATGGLTASKAKEMLRDGTAQGHKLTKKQKKYFGWVAGGKKQQGGYTDNPYQQEALDFLFEDDVVPQQQQEAPQESQEVDLEQLEKQNQELKDQDEYNAALMIAIQSGENPYAAVQGTSFTRGVGLSLNKVTKEKVGDKESYSYNYLLSKGYSPQVAAGIVANLKHESNFDPSAVGDSGKARGIAQWHPDRYAALSKQFDLNTLDGNLEALHYEMQTSERNAYDKIRRARTPEEAALMVDRYFERSAGLSTHKRMNTAKNVYNSFTNQ